MKFKLSGVFGVVVWLSITFLLSGCVPKETTPVNLADARKRVESGLHVIRPDKKGPFPTIIFIHGASDLSWQPAYEDMMKAFAKHGFATIFVDLYKGRHISGSSLRSGNLLPRAIAGDIMIAVDWAVQQSWVKQEGIGLFGISFGAASIMDALVLDAPGRLPTSLKQKPDRGLSPVRAIALLSPWCKDDIMGFNLLRAVHEDFSRSVPILAVIPTADRNSDVGLCREIFDRNRARAALYPQIERSIISHL